MLIPVRFTNYRNLGLLSGSIELGVKGISMAILSYLVAASSLRKSVDKQKLKAFIWDLFHGRFLTFPSAIFVGEARNDVDPTENSYCWEYIIPNGPDGMLDVMETLIESNRAIPVPPHARYYGNDEKAFKRVFDSISFGEQNCCLCFTANQERLSGWKGAVIYALTHPSPMTFMHPIHSEYRPLIDQPLQHYFSLYSPRGLSIKGDDEEGVLKSVLKSYFGPDLILAQSTESDAFF
jgi:hypothetical protein